MENSFTWHISIHITQTHKKHHTRSENAQSIISKGEVHNHLSHLILYRITTIQKTCSKDLTKSIIPFKISAKR